MDIFKLMYLKKKKKLDNKGAALANVLLITTFVMVLTSSVLSMAYNSYRMKLINVSSKDNFYTCEAVLEQVRVAFRNEFSAITEELGEDISDSDLSEAFEDFYADYTLDGDDYKVSTDISVSGNTYTKGNRFYDIYKVATLLTSISGTDGAKLVFGDPEYSLTYEDSKPVFTSSIVIKVDGYDNITVTLQANSTGTNNFELSATYATFHDLTVIYQEDSYESQVTTDITIEFPEVESTGSSGGSSGGTTVGWVGLEDRLKSYTTWSDLFAAGTYTDFGISSVPVTASDAVYINTTDYPANTVTSIIFEMERYSISGDAGSYSHVPVAPWVQVQDGAGTGLQYAACGGSTGYDNLYIYIGTDGDEDNPDNWIKYTDVFNTYNGFFSYSGSSLITVYQNYYNDYLTSTDGSPDVEKHVTVKYKVDLLDDNGNYNSRGWILITGTGYGTVSETITPVINSNAKMYVSIDGERTQPSYYFQYAYEGNNQIGAGGTYLSTNYSNASNWFYIDFSDTNYFVGDILHVSLHNVDAQAIADGYATQSYTLSINQQTDSIYGRGDSTVGIVYPIYTGTYTGASPYTGNCYIEVNSEDSKTLEIYIEVTWNLYPYLSFHYYNGLDEGVTIETEWVSSDGGTSYTTDSSTYNDAFIYYEDWRKE